MIAALVRAGAVDRAWGLYESGGYSALSADPAALALKGRLLKARARSAAPMHQASLFQQAADAYGAAHACSPAPYLAINAATLHLLAGNHGEAANRAQAVLAVLDGPEAQADTPYFLAATRAEALLLLDNQTGATDALREAIRHDQDGWDDRAATLAQLREVIAARGGSAEWLEGFVPPASLHFAGHLGVAPGGASEAALNTVLDRFLAEHRIGFAWGALAAGADIVIAERLLADGVELNGVLPCPPDAFERQSVAPAGSEWVNRYRAVLDACTSLRVSGQCATAVHDPLATAFAGELAIGGAVIHARRLGAAAHQLIACDEAGGGANTARQQALWRSELGPQHCFTIPRDAQVEALFPSEVPDPARQLALHVAIGLDLPKDDEERPSAEILAQIAPIAAGLAGLPAGLVRAQPDLWEFATTELAEGLAAIGAVLAVCRVAGRKHPAIGAHLAIAPLLTDPASGTLVGYGPAPALARRLMGCAPAGVALASDPLAVTLALREGDLPRTELYLPGEPGLGGSAHLLHAVDQ